MDHSAFIVLDASLLLLKNSDMIEICIYLFNAYFLTTVHNLEFSHYQKYNAWNIEMWSIKICGKKEEKNRVKD